MKTYPTRARPGVTKTAEKIRRGLVSISRVLDAGGFGDDTDDVAELLSAMGGGNADHMLSSVVDFAGAQSMAFVSTLAEDDTAKKAMEQRAVDSLAAAIRNSPIDDVLLNRAVTAAKAAGAEISPDDTYAGVMGSPGTAKACLAAIVQALGDTPYGFMRDQIGQIFLSDVWARTKGLNTPAGDGVRSRGGRDPNTPADAYRRRMLALIVGGAVYTLNNGKMSHTAALSLAAEIIGEDIGTTPESLAKRLRATPSSGSGRRKDTEELELFNLGVQIIVKLQTLRLPASTM